MKIDKVILDNLIEQGYIQVNTHEQLPLRILNYTRKTQFEKAWNPLTLACRGLVIDYANDVIALPFPKFFNYEEHSPLDLPLVPIKDYEIFDKMDGSLGIMFYYDGMWHIATRGSFHSDQAIRAKKILKKHSLDRLNIDFTYLFEIIYPENRIVCDYGDQEKLVLLGMMNRETGTDYTYGEMVGHSVNHTFELVKKHESVESVKELKSRNILNEEGYIARHYNFRMKIKFEDYCRLHSIITNVSNKDIWEFLRDGKDIGELLDRTPDEFDEWVRKTVDGLNAEFEAYRKRFVDEYLELMRTFGPHSPTKKEFALKALESEHYSVLFNIHDGKEFGSYIWKLIRPTYSKPFFKEEDEE